MKDLRRDALEQVIGTLMIDEEWAVGSEDTLSWTASRLSQTFSVTGPFMSHGTPVHRIKATVPLVRAPRVRDLAGKLNALNQFTVGDVLIYDELHDVVVSEVAVVFHEDVFDWKLKFFSSLAIIQLARLEEIADVFVNGLDGELISWTHPTNGSRSEPDDMLNVLQQVFIPTGQGPSRFASTAEFKSVERWLENTPFYTAGGGANGIAIEVALGTRDTSLIQLHADVMHPKVGAGLLVTTRLRPPADYPAANLVDLAAQMNRLESDAPSHDLLGAWHERDSELAHAYFVPNAMYAAGLTQNLAMAACVRGVWVDGQLHPEPDSGPRPSAEPIVMTRFEQFLTLFKRRPN